MSETADSVFNPQPKQNSGLGFFLVLMVVAAVAVGWYALRPMLNGGGNVKPAVDAEPLAELQLAPLTAGSTEVSLNNTSGKIVLLNFWGTWCPPCRAEFPDVVALEKKYRGSGNVLILPVSCGSSVREDMNELRANTEDFLQQRGTDMPIYSDPGLVTRKAVNDAVGFRGYPTTVLLDGEHRIREVWVGQASFEEMNAGIESLLKEHQDATAQAN